MTHWDRLKSILTRSLIGLGCLVVVLAAFAAAGRSVRFEFPLLAISTAFVLSFLIFGREIWFGFGPPSLRKAASYLISFGCALVTMYVLLVFTDPRISKDSLASKVGNGATK